MFKNVTNIGSYVKLQQILLLKCWRWVAPRILNSMLGTAFPNDNFFCSDKIQDTQCAFGNSAHSCMISFQTNV